MTFVTTVNNYLDGVDWIDKEDPVAYGLRQAAYELDGKWTTTLWGEYNKTIRYIESLKPQVEQEIKKVDPLLVPNAGLETRGA